jgi:hypothetical protein
MSTTYTYQKAVNPGRLLSEIEDELGLALYSDGTSEPDGSLETTEDACTIWLHNSLSTEDKLILDSVLERHVAGLRTEPRRSPDEALAVKIDPGTATTDPKFWPYRFTVPATIGDYWLDLSDLVAGDRLQGVVYQIEDAAYGDEVDVAICAAADSIPNPTPPPDFLPENYPLQSFGPRNVPLAPSELGWSEDRVIFDTSKPIPAGVKVRFKYSNSTATEHRITIDVLSHIEMGS